VNIVTRYIVLGRFQPFHHGHAALLTSAFELCESDDELIVAIGSSQEGWTAQNPWTIEERIEMVARFAEEMNITCTCIGIEDIHDPPKWVEHASNFHGTGTLVTSDKATQTLYESSGWEVISIPLRSREQFEGWRVRQTIRMLSTVDDELAIREVLATTLPSSTLDWLIEHDAMFRCSTFETGVHAG